jgi:D-alanyl-D-alanine carboxypeptidase (penicillin-binding protein 5/6)
MRNPAIRSIVDDRRARIAGGRRLHTWNDLLGTLPAVIGVKTGHTTAAGWSQVAAARGKGFVLYATLLGSPARATRNADLAELIRWGLSRYTLARVVDGERVYGRAEVGYGIAPVAVVPSRSLVRSVRVDRPLRERVVITTAVELPVRKGQTLGAVSVFDGERLLARSPLVAARTVERPGSRERARWYVTRAAEKIWP